MKKKILIVEDEFVVANSLRLLLEQAGYDVMGIAASAEEAEELSGQHQPDLVLLDIRLEGDRSGIDLARSLRSRHIGFVYLSANSSQKVLEEAKTTEPYGFLIKPFREKDLLVTLDIAWYRHHQSSEAKSRREKYLVDNLMQIGAEGLAKNDRLLRLVRLLQPHLSFEIMFSVTVHDRSGESEVLGFMRTGYDQYHHIGKTELINMIGYDPFQLQAQRQSANSTGIKDNDSDSHKLLTEICSGLSKKVDLGGQLTISLPSVHGSTTGLCFYSRQRLAYGTEQSAMLEKLSARLGELLAGRTTGRAFKTDVSAKSPEGRHRTAVLENIVGEHPSLLAALDLTVQVAPYNTSVLILGESGTGKENIAQAIHALSGREKGPFIKINCAAIPAGLMESELFGHEKGAFTGANEMRRGSFELADGGTLFLDEIGEMSLDMQVKLLRALQEKEITPVGARIAKKIDIRVVAATNKNLEKEVGEGKFRLDLYYRLNVFPIILPPLRERRSDIVALAIHFARKFSREFNKPYPGLSAAMTGQLIAYNWPGNIRELENVMERSVILNYSGNELSLSQDLSGSDGAGPATGIESFQDIKKLQQDTEREYLISILKKTDGRIRGANGAAELLNMKPTTLESKMAKLGISRVNL